MKTCYSPLNIEFYFTVSEQNDYGLHWSTLTSYCVIPSVKAVILKGSILWKILSIMWLSLEPCRVWGQWRLTGCCHAPYTLLKCQNIKFFWYHFGCLCNCFRNGGLYGNSRCRICSVPQNWSRKARIIFGALFLIITTWSLLIHFKYLWHDGIFFLDLGNVSKNNCIKSVLLIYTLLL